MAGWLRLETKNSDISSQIKYNSKLSTTSLEHKVRSIRRIIKANSFLFLVGGVVLIISTPNHNVDIIKQTPVQNMKDVRNLPPIKLKAAIKSKKDRLKI